MDLRVEYFRDDDTGNWGFSVPSLRITGGAETREQAEEQARDAILFTLEGDDDGDLLPGGEIGYFRVTVEKAAAAHPL